MNNKVSISVVIGVTDEVESLKNNLNILMNACNPDDISEILLVSHSRTTPEMLKEVENYCSQRGPFRFNSYSQKNIGFGYFLIETLPVLKGDYAVYCGADNATDLSLINVFAQKIKENLDSVIFASRWLPGGGFEGYGKLNVPLNHLFQKFVAALYRTDVSDFSFAYQCVPVSLYKQMSFKRKDVSVFLESRLRLIKSNANIVEVPAFWKGRTGKTQKFYPRRLLIYTFISLYVLFDKNTI